jgi:hypothetical protein
MRKGYNVQLTAPPGKFRLIGVDLFSHEEYLVRDYLSREKAFKAADTFNKRRSGSMDDSLLRL